jgi:hypothetical protein
METRADAAWKALQNKRKRLEHQKFVKQGKCFIVSVSKKYFVRKSMGPQHNSCNKEEEEEDGGCRCSVAGIGTVMT